MKNCELCESSGGTLLWQSSFCRIVRVDDADYPGFCRVILQDHVREMTDLSAVDRRILMETVFAVEEVIRRLFSPDKINLASFGNMTPHVHWHVIPRWQDDRHFPNPIWGSVQRSGMTERAVISDAELQAALVSVLGSVAASSGQGG